MTELDSAVRSVKSIKAGDEYGLAAELLHYAPPSIRQVLAVLLDLFNQYWKKMLLMDYKPIVALRLLYKAPSYLALFRKCAIVVAVDLCIASMRNELGLPFGPCFNDRKEATVEIFHTIHL